MLTTNIEDSIKLRDIGAPQDTVFAWNNRQELADMRELFKPVSLNFDGKKDYYAAYTLSELIEWLGDDFGSLQQHQEKYLKSDFSAVSVKNHGKEIVCRAFGETPLDALVQLTLAVKTPKEEV